MPTTPNYAPGDEPDADIPPDRLKLWLDTARQERMSAERLAGGYEVIRTLPGSHPLMPRWTMAHVAEAALNALKRLRRLCN